MNARIKQLPPTIAAVVMVALATTLNAQPRYESVHTFSGDRGQPVAALTEGPDGKLYGTTRFGGFHGKGTVFVTDTAGNTTTLHEFNGADGETPDGRLLLAPDGMLYGTTASSSNAFGTVYRLMPDGSAFEVLVEFTGLNGLIPRSGLVLGIDGALYGTTTAGGKGSAGTIFRLTTTATLTTLVAFDGTNGAAPSGDLFPVSDGFYGTTAEGGTLPTGDPGFGTVFHVGLDGTLTTLVVFDGTSGSAPGGGVVLASDGNLYGTTQFGPGAEGVGTVFRITAAGLETLLAFSGADGAFPTGALRQLGDAVIYGTTPSGGSANSGTVFVVSLDGTVTSLVSFTGGNGRSPESGLIKASTGKIYGTTTAGGSGLYGTIFELAPDPAVITTICPFSGATLADPSGGLIESTDGNIYGIAFGGGAEGAGATFQVTPDGTVTTLASFDADEGLLPTGALIQASDGHLYGTLEGGVAGNGGVFRLTLGATPTLTTIDLFDFELTGATPSGRLIEGSDGQIYGTVLFGAGGAPGGVFRIDRAEGKIYNVATLNPDGTEGTLPLAGVVEAPDGSLYGTASEGGTSTVDRPQGFGTIFRVSGGAVSPVVLFSGGNGQFPAAPLLVGVDGHLYGTTSEGGAIGNGTLFRLTLGEVPALSTLVSFDGVNGWWPFQQGVVETTPGVLVGSTTFGGDLGLGNVYQWSAAGGIVSLHQFDGADGEMPNATVLKGADGTLYGTAFGPQGGVIFRLVADRADASLSVPPVTAIYGGSTTIAATLTVAGAPIAGAEISFSLNGVPRGSVATNSAGIATLSGVTIAGLNAGPYPGVVLVSFAGNNAAGPASALADLLVARATPTIAVESATFTYDGQAHPANATVTGVAGEVLGPLTVTYNGGAVVPIDPGSYDVVASFAGNTNYEPASATGTITIRPAPAGLNGLVAAYGFNEGGGSVAGDASGRGHYGRIKQAQWSARGRFGGALDFDGVDDWVTVRDAAALDIRYAITIEAWVHPRALFGWNTIVLKESDTGLAYALYANDSLPQPAGYVNVAGADRAISGLKPLLLNTWTHVAMTYDGAAMRLFIGGVEVKRRALTGRILATHGVLRIGGNSVWGEYFNGLIDEVRIYNRALSDTEIKRDMAMPVAFERTPPSVEITSPADGAVLSGLPTLTVAASDDFMLSNVQVQANGVEVGKPMVAAPFSTRLDLANGTYVLTAIARDAAGNSSVSAPVTVTIANAPVASYDFDELSGTDVLDASGNNHHGSMSAGVTRTVDVMRGRVLSFNGADGMVSIAATELLALSSGMTLEAWLRPTELSGWRTVFLKERPNGLSYALYANDSAPWPAGYVHTTSDGEVEGAVTGREPLPLNHWTHLAMTYDGAMLRLFIDGKEVASRAQTGHIEVSDQALRIGGNAVWGEWFAGQIDSVRIYGVAVGEAQIKADMQR